MAVWLITLASDMVSKAIARHRLFPEPWPHVLLPHVLWLEFLRNPGGLFGAGSTSTVGRWLPGLQLSLLVPLYLLWQRMRADDAASRAWMAVVAAGVAGNAASRLFDGYVIDFVVVSAFGHGHLAGNVADGALAAGAIGLIRTVRRHGVPDRTALAMARLRMRVR